MQDKPPCVNCHNTGKVGTEYCDCYFGRKLEEASLEYHSRIAEARQLRNDELRYYGEDE